MRIEFTDQELDLVSEVMQLHQSSSQHQVVESILGKLKVVQAA